MSTDNLSVAAIPAPRAQINPWLVAPVVAMAAFMEVLDISIANVALQHIAGSLAASVDESTWVLTSYTVTNVIVVPISGWLSSVMGRKRYFLASIAGFTVSSMLCGLAPTLGILVLFRALQGISGGGLQPASQAILSDAFPPAKRGVAFAMYGLAVVFAPAIGPTLGGWITDHIGWRWVFLINIPVGVIVFTLVEALVQDPEYMVKARAERRRQGLRVDYIGFSLLAIGLACMQFVLDRGQQDDWFASHLILILGSVSAIGLIAFVIWELNERDPLVDLHLLRNRNFAIANLQMLALGAVLLASIVLIPIYVQELLGYTATDAGLVLTPGGLALVLFMPIMGQLVTKIDVRALIGFGFLLAGLSMLYAVNFDTTTAYSTIMWNRVIFSISLAFLFIPINVAAYAGLPIEKSSNASALINMSRNLGSSIGISLATAWLSRRAQYHQSLLVQQVNNFNPNYHQAVQGLSHLFASVSQGASQAMAKANGAIYETIVQQANMLAFLDDFKALAICALALVPLAFLLKKASAAGPTASH
ncbi:MAG: DHA2 family efflux MFS transporter permease subunit [Gammaproteobacteria bacterium]